MGIRTTDSGGSMRSSTGFLLVVFAAMGTWTASSPVRAQGPADFPSRPIRLLVPAVAGAASDLTARSIAQKMTDTWNRQVIVDNRGGAAGALAMELMAKAAPDGYTLLLTTASYPINAAVNPKWQYDNEKDFAAVSLATTIFYVAYHNPSVPVKSMEGLIAYANANPGKLNYGSTGAGSLMHLGWELFGHTAGVKLVHVPYKGGAQIISATLTGDVQIGFGTLTGLRPHLSTGRLRALAITAKDRSPVVPELPTLAETGLPGYELTQFYGVMTGGKVSSAIIRKLNAAIVEALKAPDVVQRLTADGSTPVGSSPKEFAAFINAEIARWRKLVKDTGLALH